MRDLATIITAEAAIIIATIIAAIAIAERII